MPRPNDLPDELSSVAKAAIWSSRLMTVGLEMSLPSAAGYWVDRKLGTGVLFVVLGAVLGFAAGLYHLLAMVASENGVGKGMPQKRSPRDDDSEGSP